MPNINVTKDEQTILMNAVADAVSSAKRQQNSKRGTPQIKEVYATHERVLNALLAKVADAK